MAALLVAIMQEGGYNLDVIGGLLTRFINGLLTRFIKGFAG